jgi:uncharacterized LabA/DUF88 family protein
VRKLGERAIYVFIDASNLWEAQKAKGRFLDYRGLISIVKEMYQGSSVETFYYTAYPPDGTRGYSSDGKHKFFQYLKEELGFNVVKKPLKRILHTDSDGRRFFLEKGNMDIEMTIDLVRFVDDYDIAVLFTGDSDFLAVLRFLRARGKKAFIFSSRNNISRELRTGGDGYVDVLTLPERAWGRQIVRRKK